MSCGWLHTISNYLLTNAGCAIWQPTLRVQSNPAGLFNATFMFHGLTAVQGLCCCLQTADSEAAS